MKYSVYTKGHISKHELHEMLEEHDDPNMNYRECKKYDRLDMNNYSEDDAMMSKQQAAKLENMIKYVKERYKLTCKNNKQQKKQQSTQ